MPGIPAFMAGLAVGVAIGRGVAVGAIAGIAVGAIIGGVATALGGPPPSAGPDADAVATVATTAQASEAAANSSFSLRIDLPPLAGPGPPHPAVGGRHETLVR